MSTIKHPKHERKIAIGMETSYGDGTTAVSRYLPVEDATFDYVKDSVIKETQGVRAAALSSYKREGVITPSISGDVEADSIGELLLCTFGTIATGTNLENISGTQFLHTYTLAGTVSDALPSCRFVDEFSQGTAFTYAGIRGNTLTFNVVNKETLKYSFDGIGQREVGGTTETGKRYGTWRPFIFKDMEITIDGTVRNDIYNFELSVNRNLSEGFRLGTQEYTTRPLPGKSEVSASFSVEWDYVNRDRYLNGSTFDMQVKFTGETIGGTGKNQININLPKVVFQTAPNSTGDDELRTIDVTAIAFEGGTSDYGTSEAIRVLLYNSINAY